MPVRFSIYNQPRPQGPTKKNGESLSIGTCQVRPWLNGAIQRNCQEVTLLRHHVMTPPTTYPYPCAVYAVSRCLGRLESGQIYQFMASHLVAVDGVACVGYAN